jgi:hypothetical protein
MQWFTDAEGDPIWPPPETFWNVVCGAAMAGLGVVGIETHRWSFVVVCALLTLANLYYVVPELIRLWWGKKPKEDKGQERDKP